MNFQKTGAVLSIALVALTLGTGCQSKKGANQYAAHSVGGAFETYQGVIHSTRRVQISESEKLQDNKTGMGVGALAGGLAGSAFGKGKGKLVGMGIGALAGGAAGMFIEEALGNQEGIEYVVRLTNGRLQTIVQGDDIQLSVGQRVFVQIPDGRMDRARVVPDNSGMPMEIQEMKQTNTSAPLVVINR